MNLAARSLKYYLFIGLQRIGITLGVSLLIFVEFLLLRSGEPDFLMSALRMAIMMFSVFVMLLNPVYSLYGPNWYDSNVLAMGGRRKDIFWCAIAKELFYVFACMIIVCIVHVLMGSREQISFALVLMAVGLPMAGIMRIIGHKVKKHGKLPIIIIALTSGVIGCVASMAETMGIDIMSYLPTTPAQLIVFILVCLLIYALLQIWVYKLCSKAMVQ